MSQNPPRNTEESSIMTASCWKSPSVQKTAHLSNVQIEK